VTTNEQQPAISRRDRWANRFDLALTVLAAGVATGVAANGMWRVAGDALKLDGPVRALLFAFAEVGLVVSAIRARRNYLRSGATGPDGMAVWVIAVGSGVVSATDAHATPAVLVRLAAPILAAWLWHRGLHATTTGVRRRDTVTWRVTPRRILAALRIVEPGDVGIADVDRRRQLDRVVRAAHRLHTTRSALRRRWAQRTLTRATRAARGALDDDGRELVRARLATLYAAERGTAPAAVATLDPWSVGNPLSPRPLPVTGHRPADTPRADTLTPDTGRTDTTPDTSGGRTADTDNQLTDTPDTGRRTLGADTPGGHRPADTPRADTLTPDTGRTDTTPDTSGGRTADTDNRPADTPDRVAAVVPLTGRTPAGQAAGAVSAHVNGAGNGQAAHPDSPTGQPGQSGRKPSMAALVRSVARELGTTDTDTIVREVMSRRPDTGADSVRRTLRRLRADNGAPGIGGYL
jgi:hypothetical protein